LFLQSKMEIEKSAERKKVTINTLLRMKAEHKKAAYVTAYDFPSARRADRAGMDIVLVGDSMGMTVYGFDNTLQMNMDIMIPHADAVARGAKHSFVIGDMPYMSYQLSDLEAVLNASTFIRAGCSAVKCEGGKAVAPRIRAMHNAGILVQGHLGLTPQSTAALGGYTIQARTDDAISRLVGEAKAIEEAGAFSILLEAVPPEAGKKVSAELKIPIYGIGAGPYVDGQLLICHDLLGTYEGKLSGNIKIPKFAKKYAELGKLEEEAFRRYIEEVHSGEFPSSEHFYKMEEPERPCSER